MKYIVLSLLLLSCLFLRAQDPQKELNKESESIEISNGSFEFKKRAEDFINLKSLEDWYDVNESISAESPPTWHGVVKNMFNVKMKASNGKRFMGFVVRDNGSLESLAQNLESKLEHGVSYSFSFYNNHSKRMSQVQRVTVIHGNKGLREPIELQAGLNISVWDSETKNLYVLVRITEYPSAIWTKKTINFTAPCNCDTLIFSSDFIEEIKEEKGFYYGNVLLDDVSNISVIK